MQNFNIYNPYDNLVIGSLKFDKPETIEKKIDKCYQYSLNRTKWLSKYERIKILKSLIKLMIENQKELITTAIQEGGKPYLDTKIEFERAIITIESTIANIYNPSGRMIQMGLTPSTNKRIAYAYREPVGLVFAISAFNHPINLIIHQIVTCIATNCPVIIKPALKTPYSCIKIVNLIYEAGLSKNLCQIVLCENEMTSKLSTDKRLGLLSFIGSEKVGWQLKSNVAPGVKCILEHGGVAPSILEKDADLKTSLPKIIKGAFYHSGQVCVSTQKLFVNQNILNIVIEKLKKLTERLIIGDPQDVNIGVNIGPLITLDSINRIDLWVQNAIKKGAQLISGGKKISPTVYQPTLLLDPPDDVEVSQYEIFGPVLCIYSYKDNIEVISRANNLEYQFQASVFTKDIDHAIEFTKNLKASNIFINDHTAFRADWMPFEGRKLSGFGSGGVFNLMKELTYEKMFIINSKNLE